MQTPDAFHRSTQEGERLLRVSQVARRLASKERTVRWWAEIGELPAFKVGRQWRFNEWEIEQHIERKRRGS